MLIQTVFCCILLLYITVSGDYRLPYKILPQKYQLDLEIFPEKDTYKGVVRLYLHTGDKPVSSFEIHASLQHFQIIEVKNGDFSCLTENVDNITQIIKIECFSELEEFVEFHIKGKYSNDYMQGVYKKRYEDDDGSHFFIGTQFKPLGARKVFPCFDEPRYKAFFELHITHPRNYTVLGNTLGSKKRLDEFKSITTFETTPKMPTYLLGFFVSKFERSHQSYSRNTTKHFLRTAIKYQQNITDAISNWTGLDYISLGNKQANQIALPKFHSKAIENWGLIGYGELFIIDELKNTTSIMKQTILINMAQKISQQWFGAYVTSQWWSEAWLSEGFASYLAYKISQQINEDFELDKQFVINEQQTALEKDSLSNSPLSSPEANVSTEDKIVAVFDGIIATKGASVLRMINYIFGEETFRKAVHSYLSEEKYSYTTYNTLLNHLSRASKSKQFSTRIEPWITETGYPLVTVQLIGSKLNITQEKFNSGEEGKWFIPISYTTADEKNFTVEFKTWLTPQSSQVIELNTNTSWIIFNLQSSGFYRVNYCSELWLRIIRALNGDDRESIHVLNRAQLIDDAFNLAEIKAENYKIFLNLIDGLKNETHYYPWVTSFKHFSYLLEKLDRDVENTLKKKILEYIDNAFANDIQRPTHHVDKLKERLIKKWACKLGQKECLQTVQEMFSEFKKTSNIQNHEIKETVFCYGLKTSKDQLEDYEFLLNLYKTSVSPLLQSNVLSALGCASDSTVIKRLLKETIQKESCIQPEDISIVFDSICNNEGAIDEVLSFLDDNLKVISIKFNNSYITSSFITCLAKRLKDGRQLSKFKKIIESNAEIENVKIVTAPAMKIIEANNAWRKLYQNVIATILKDPEGKSTKATTPKTTSKSTKATSTTTLPRTSTQSSTQRTDNPTNDAFVGTTTFNTAIKLHLNYLVLSIICFVTFSTL